ncbi:TonB family protein [Minwuia sp.]|uniref:energy transducer TonB n=1 Tax=Minwuia sp. TaxID=2493630 RepID=UPI003A94587F
MRPVGKRTWLFALPIAATIHIGIGAALLWQPEAEGAAAPGAAGLQVGLAMSGAAPGDAASVSGDLTEAVPEAPEAVDTVQPETIAEAPVEVTHTATVPIAAAEVTPETPIEAATPPEPSVIRTEPVPTAIVPHVTELPVTPAEPVIETGHPPEIVEAVPPEVAVEAAPPDAARAEPVAAAAPPPPPPPAPPRSVVRVRPEPEPRAQTVPAPATAPATEQARSRGSPDQAASTDERETARATPSGAGGKAGRNDDTGTASDTGDQGGGGTPGQQADYLTQLQLWLERHKAYPRRAQRRRQEGTAMLYFRMARDGTVLYFRIEQSSGHTTLDREVEAMIKRAQPLPAMPDFMPQARLELIVPVVFAMP